ncbi:hypothetical protein [Fibrobacter sp. UWB11]|uniref:hypothetical protein n=1 Tax=Fibrobacter sp. UWB11 TaxID=1896202 RepID=UPI00092781AB|nr:hypothetical protein [Fibrobacter sp. UWB11]SIO34544.1 hypothetical protein SAMN05720758_2448 [Fibrobacter sp. UWB11]
MKEKILETIRSSTGGIEVDMLSSIVKDQLHIKDQSIIDEAVGSLTSEKKIKCKEKRWIATENQNFGVSKYYEEIGGPHSPEGMKTLEEFFVENTEKITILVDVTSVVAFKKLCYRIDHDLLTEVILPPENEINIERRDNYKKVKKEWIEFYKSHKKDCFTLLQSTVINKAVRTTLFSKEKARINIRKLSARSTRDGNIIVVGNDNTLYKQFANEIIIQQLTADYCFTANPMKWLWRKIIKKWIFILLVFLIMIISFINDQKIIGFVTGVLTGAAGNCLYELFSINKKFK